MKAFDPIEMISASASDTNLLMRLIKTDHGGGGLTSDECDGLDLVVNAQRLDDEAGSEERSGDDAGGGKRWSCGPTLRPRPAQLRVYLVLFLSLQFISVRIDSRKNCSLTGKMKHSVVHRVISYCYIGRVLKK